MPDWADRPKGEDPARWRYRPLHAPGSRFKYNDVRVNLLAWALLQVHRRPLPEVLRERIMDPIGASTTWRWHSGCWGPSSDVRAQVRNRYSCMPLRRSMTRSTENSRRHLPRSSGV